MKASGKRLIIEGHTDDQTISGASMDSNWELASLRALQHRLAVQPDAQGRVARHQELCGGRFRHVELRVANPHAVGFLVDAQPRFGTDAIDRSPRWIASVGFLFIGIGQVIRDSFGYGQWHLDTVAVDAPENFFQSSLGNGLASLF